jgi:hypothetical protein
MVCCRLACVCVCVWQAAPPPLPRGARLGTLGPVPALTTACGVGCGVAVCPALGLLVTSNSSANTLSVFALPGGARGGGAGGGGLSPQCTLGGPGSLPSMQFMFSDGNFSGWMTFTGPSTSGDAPPLLLVTDGGHDAVHVIDVVARTHVGHVGAPGSIPGPRGVAARGSLVAVSSWKRNDSGEHTVRLFEGAGSGWAPLRVLGGGFGMPGAADGQMKWPYGLRFTGDGTGVAVAEEGNDRVSLFRVADGSFVRQLATGLSYPFDVEECEGGWLVAGGAFGSSTVAHVGGYGKVSATLGKYGRGDGEFYNPSALALVPGLGLVVREAGNNRVQVFQ